MRSVEWIAFDCYGTLIDWETGITTALRPFLPPSIASELLADRYIAVEAEVEREGYRPYREVLVEASARLMTALGAPLPPDHSDVLPRSLPGWRPFPEVPQALRRLRDAGYRLAILSNVDRDLLAASIRSLGFQPDLAITAEDCRSYKPAPRHWEEFQRKSGAHPSRTVHVAASLYHDIATAGSLGYRTVFINRRGERVPPDGPRPTRVLRDLAGLPEAIEELSRLPAGEMSP